MTTQGRMLAKQIEADEIELASSNFDAQESLFLSIHKALESKGLTIEEVAERLEISADEVGEWLSGDADLTMSELRYLATAIDARITYRVEAGVTEAMRFIELRDISRWQNTVWSSHPVGARS